MGKTKRARIPNYNHHDNPARTAGARNASQQKLKGKQKQKQGQQAKVGKNAGDGGKRKQGQGHQQRNQLPVIPFLKSDRILLIGEGDFSFATSLIRHHGCSNVLATCYDQETTLYEKYPQTKETIQDILSLTLQPHEPATTVTASEPGTKRKRDSDDDDDDAHSSDESTTATNRPKKQPRIDALPNVLFGIDARKLGSGLAGGAKTVRQGFPRPSLRQPAPGGPKGGPWDVICFNFPHVGGLSKDVNRQVRANQDLLVSFFKAAAPLLAAPVTQEEGGSEGNDEDEEGYDTDFSDFSGEEGADDPVVPPSHAQPERTKPRTTPGQILVTLFEGEPYTLWNIRDLARHAGLRVVTSFKFPWASYPGYSHARTIGEIEGRHGGRGGWRGEDREARTYVFEKKEWEAGPGAVNGGKGGRKRRRKNADGDDDDASD